MEAATRAGFRWYSFSAEYHLHVVELDRATPRGRVRALAFARPTEGDLRDLERAQATG